MKKRKKHSPEQIVTKLRDANVMLNTVKDLAAVLQVLEVSEATYHRWRAQKVVTQQLMNLEEATRQLNEKIEETWPFIQMLVYSRDSTTSGRPKPWLAIGYALSRRIPGN